jgi:flagellar FliL protein
MSNELKRLNVLKGDSGQVNAIVVVIIIFVQLILAVGVYFFILRDNNPEPARLQTIERTDVHIPQRNDPPPRQESRQEPRRESNFSDSSSSSGFGARDFVRDFAIFPLGDVVVNTADSPEPRFFVTSISFEYRQSDKRLPDELKRKTPMFRDSIIQYFSRLTVDELRNIDNRERFREDIMRSINNMLLEGRVTNIFFEQFVIQ